MPNRKMTIGTAISLLHADLWTSALRKNIKRYLGLTFVEKRQGFGGQCGTWPRLDAESKNCFKMSDVEHRDHG